MKDLLHPTKALPGSPKSDGSFVIAGRRSPMVDLLSTVASNKQIYGRARFVTERTNLLAV